MNSDYYEWMKTKDEVNKGNRLFFHERGIWFCILGKNIGYEQNGSGKQFLRPVIIFKRFNDKVCLIIPLTTKNKTGFITTVLDLKIAIV